MHKPIVILNSISDNYDSFGNIYTWNGYIENSTKHSILKYVDTHSDELKDKYLEFIHDLGEYVHDNKKIRDYQRRMAALGALVLEGRAGAAQSLGCLRPGLFPPPLSLCWWRGSACSP